ncbi:MAG: D-sedoheptulose 7-phosphate isomerase [candidate division Zixibacteria bacterium]|nr:D-sedoheptulose 7-phosphate isomerase [candidate division Zixibacteria bacterium]
MKQIIQQSLDSHAEVLRAVGSQLIDRIAEAGEILIAALERGNKILLCGNGGSAADAQHIAAELTGRFLKTNRRPLPAIALTTDTSALTAVGNDFGFDHIFSRQLQALGSQGDILVAISTSGNSANVLAAVTAAAALGLNTLALTGGNGGKLKEVADIALVMPSSHTPHIQEMHILIAHILCDLIDRHFSSSD